MISEELWRSAMRAHGVDVAAIDQTLDEAVVQPAMQDEVVAAEVALQNSADIYIAGKLSLAIAYAREAAALAMSLRKELALIPQVLRDRARQAGTKKARNPQLQHEIDLLVKRFPDHTAAELWAKSSRAISDQIEIGAFTKRVTAARKARR